MSKRLYLVNAWASFEMAVLADSKEEAERIAEQNAGDEFDNVGSGFDCSVVDQPIPHDFHDSIPWGGDGDATVAEILAKEQGK